MRKATFLFTIAAFLYTTQLIGQVKLTASTDARQVVTNQYFNVTFTVEGAKGNNFRAPSFLEFDVIGGPSTSTQVSIINGQRSIKSSYTYALSCPKAGTFSIEPATVSVNGKEYTSQSLKIEVLTRKESNAVSNTADASDDFILEATIDHETAYVGQQLVLKYVLYTTKDVRSFNMSQQPDFDGFYAQELNTYRSRPQMVVRDGKQYYQQDMKVFALFPQQRGNFKIRGVRCALGVTDGKRSSSFFFNTRLKTVYVNTEDIDISIVKMPDNAPASFSGAIGDFRMGTHIDKKTVRKDDAITLTLQIKGFGDGKFIEAPQQSFTDKFDIYDPNLLQDKSELVGDHIESTKTFEYLMIPKEEGQVSFRPEFTFFNVDSSVYETIKGELYTVKVLPGSNREREDIADNVTTLPDPPAINGLKNIGQTFAYSPPHLIANGGIALGFLGLLLGYRRQQKQEQIDPAEKRRQRAEQAAIQQLSLAKTQLDNGDIKQFYIVIRQSIQDYLSDKLNLPSNQHSKESIKSILQKYHLESHSDSLLQIMNRGEQAIYASIRPGNEEEDYRSVLDFIKASEEQLNS